MHNTVWRLKPDPEKFPVWLREEIVALADDFDHLPVVERRQAVKRNLSERARAYFVDQASRALSAPALLT